MRRAVILALLAIPLAACGRAEIPLDGAYTRGAFHRILFCGGATPGYHESDLLYPTGTPSSTFAFHEDANGRVRVEWGGVELATGTRQGSHVELAFTRPDPYTAPVAEPWLFQGRVRDDLVFHERTVVGTISGGSTVEAGLPCTMTDRGVAWFTTRPRGLDRVRLAGMPDAAALGDWNRFVWFFVVGPLGMERKGDPGQRGRNEVLFSFVATQGGTVARTSNGIAVADGLPEDGGGAHPGTADGTGIRYDATNGSWETRVSLDVLYDDGAPRGSSHGVHRVLAGFVTGDVAVSPSVYPAGWTGPTGMQPIQSPGLAFFAEVDQPVAHALSSGAPNPLVLADAAAPVVRLFDGVPEEATP